MDPSILKFAQMAAIFVTTSAALAVVMLAFNVATRLVRRLTSQAPDAAPAAGVMKRGRSRRRRSQVPNTAR